MSRVTEQLPFMIFDETTKSFPKYNATEDIFLIKFRTQGGEQETTVYLMNASLHYLVT